MSAREPAKIAMSADDSFGRRCLDAERGALLPRIGDLIRGCPFFQNDMAADATIYADDLMNRLAPPDDPIELLAALEAMLAAPGQKTFLEAAAAFEAAARAAPDRLKQVGSVRFHLYAALSGSQASVSKIAAYAVEVAYTSTLTPSTARQYVAAAVAWLLAATGKAVLPTDWCSTSAKAFLGRATDKDGPGRSLLERMLRSRTDMLLVASGPLALPAQHPGAHSSQPAPRLATGELTPQLAIVANYVGNPISPDGARIRAEFSDILGVALPLAPVPNLSSLRAAILGEFPHAAPVLDVLLPRLRGTSCVRLAPILLVGPHGCGKTTFALRFAELLGLPVEILPCGGAGEAALAGTSRRWSTAEPSLPVSLMRAHRHASPAIILDELDKSSRASGSFPDGLLGMLESRTARAWRDPYLAAPVDLTNVVWIGTANNLNGIPNALVERCRVVRFPAPRREHLACLAHRILVADALDQGLDPRWAAAPDQAEIAALASAWHGGSIRRLAKLVSVIAQARELERARH